MGFEKLNTLKNQMDELKSKMYREAQDNLLEGLNDVFATTDLVGIRWRQYTPYFNDGDACYFGISDVYFRWNDTEEEDGDYDDGYVWSHDDATRGELTKRIRQVINSLEDVADVMFGDHVMVTVTADGVQVEDYEHD